MDNVIVIKGGSRKPFEVCQNHSCAVSTAHANRACRVATSSQALAPAWTVHSNRSQATPLHSTIAVA